MPDRLLSVHGEFYRCRRIIDIEVSMHNEVRDMLLQILAELGRIRYPRLAMSMWIRPLDNSCATSFYFDTSILTDRQMSVLLAIADWLHSYYDGFYGHLIIDIDYRIVYLETENGILGYSHSYDFNLNYLNTRNISRR